MHCAYDPDLFISTRDIKISLVDHSKGKCGLHVIAYHLGLSSWREAAQILMDNRKHPFFDSSTTARIDRIADILSQDPEDGEHLHLPANCYLNDFMCKFHSIW